MDEPLPFEAEPFPGKAGTCVLPSTTSRDLTYTKLEHVLLNSFFGLKNFFIYDEFISHKFVKSIGEARRHDEQLAVQVLPFNPPWQLEPNLTLSLISLDCFYRTRKIWDSRVILTSTQVLVPKKGNSLQKALKQSGVMGNLDLSLRSFCSELPSDETAASNTYSIIALEQTTFEKSSSKTLQLQHRLKLSTEAHVISSDVLVVNDYASCGKFDFDNESDLEKDVTVTNYKKDIEKRFGSFFHLKHV